jgi:uncharacterized membrane protein YfcA
MKERTLASQAVLLPVSLNAGQLQWGIAGGGPEAYEKLRVLLQYSDKLSVTVIAGAVDERIKRLGDTNSHLMVLEKEFEISDVPGINMLIIATGNQILDEKIQSQAKQQNVLVQTGSVIELSDFVLSRNNSLVPEVNGKPALVKHRPKKNTEQIWRSLTSKLILAFLLMVIGHIVISYLPLPSIGAIFKSVRPYFDYQFLFFIMAGFLAQMVDGTLGMGYGVTSATCLMTFGISPVSVSAAIHTSEIFTTATSGYSHYKFGNVNKKMFRHLVIPGVIGAVLGAIMLVFVGEKYGKWLMPVIALYAMFLGLKILIKAFQQQTKNKKIKRLGWLAGVGGFLDSFGGGGWGPIVTSSLIAKGRSPRYTIGSVNLAEFFITLASAFTFFMTVGVSHWNVVLGLLIGGGVASPLAARMAGKLPRKTMMIAVGIMIMIWCVRMIIKSVA